LVDLVCERNARFDPAQSIAALTKAVREFAGGVIIVSHDAALLSDVCSELIVVAHGTATRFEGGVEGYRRALLAGEL
jgi:ATP-binding cassette, subfamily F, member 3